MTRALMRLVALALFVAVLVPVASAQFNAAIQGTVTDPSGAVVPGATVTATNLATGVSRTTVTTDAGLYRIVGLPPGTYSVEVEARNFKKLVRNNVPVAAETVRGLDVKLELGASEQSVTVSAEATPLETENPNMAGTISRNQVSNLPQFGRDPYELLRLAPGVFGDMGRNGSGQAIALPNGVGPGGSNSSIFQTENQVQISANGQRVSGNNFTIDGVDVNSLTWGGAAVVSPNQESVQEIKVLASSYSAEDGRGSGAQIKVISKTGTNNLHGSAFIRNSSPGLNAYNNFAGWQSGFGRAPNKRVNVRENSFGGSLGGPILKDKLFFFFSYEGLRRSTADMSVPTYIETPEFRNLLKTARAGGVSSTILQDGGIEPRVANILTPSCSDINNGTAACQVVAGGLDLGSPVGALGEYALLDNYVGGGFDGIPDVTLAQLVLPSQFSGNQFNGRVDFTHGKDQFAVSTYVTLADTYSSDLDSQSRPMSDLRNKPKSPAVTLLWNRIISSTMLNEMRVNWSRFAYNQLETSQGVNFGIPRSEIEGIFTNGARLRYGAPRSEATPGIFAQNTYAFRDIVSKTFSRFGLRAGFEMRREQDNNNLLGGARPVYSSVRLWNFANDTPIYEAINVDPLTGKPADSVRHFRTRNYAAFGQTDWKLRPNLTVNLGLRYEYFSPLTETDGKLTNFDYPAGNLPGGKVVVTDQLFSADRNNFAPKIGFAWDPWSEGKTVFRGGFGISYNRMPDVLFANTRGNPPFFARYSICCGTAATDFGTPFADGQIMYALGSDNSIYGYPVNPALVKNLDPSTNLPANNATVEIWGTPQNMPTPYVYSYSLDMQREFPRDFTLTLGYSGNTSHKLIRIVNQTFIFDNLTGNKADPTYLPQPDVNANFNALNVLVSKRFRHGYQFDFKYRWSKSIDQLSNEGPGFVTNQTYPRDQRYERGPSDYDARHNLVLSGIWELPIFRGRRDLAGSLLGGWQITGVYTWHTGFPWTPISYANCFNTPGGKSICPTRPVGYTGNAPYDNSNEALLSPTANFPAGGPAYFDVTHQGVPGIGRNSFRGPNFRGFDLTLGKSFYLPFINEDAKIDFRADAFNLFNITNLAPFGFASGSTNVGDQYFGKALDGLAGRVVQLQAKIVF